MKKIQSYFVVTVLIFQLSCKKSEESVEIVTQPGSQEVEEEPKQAEVNFFYFSSLSGRCTDSDGLEGSNPGVQECGDISEQNVSEVDLTNKTLYGLNLKGTTLINSKLNFKNIADIEMKIDEQTYFDKVKNPFTRLFDQHLILMSREEKKSTRANDSARKLHQKIEDLKERLLKARNADQEQKIANQIQKHRLQIDAHNQTAMMSLNKRERHKDYASALYNTVLTEPAYTNPKISNKKELELNGETTFSGESSDSYFQDSEPFALSIWISTNSLQQDKRILNFHHSSGPQSAVNIQLRSKEIALGYRNEKKDYHEIRHTLAYADSSLIHIMATYDLETFRLYINGNLVGTKIDSFVGFGSYPFFVGSYDGKSRFFEGSIDEISLWKSSLSDQAVLAIYHDGIPTNLNRHRDSQDLTNWWRMGDGQSKKVPMNTFIDQVSGSALTIVNP